VNELRDKQFAVIGAGNIGSILLERLLAAGVSADHLVVCDADRQRAFEAAQRFGVRPISLADEAACSADALLIAVPPKAVSGLLQRLCGWLRTGQVVISFAAITPLEKLETLLPEDIPVARVMPNAPSLVGQGMNPVSYGRRITPASRALVEAILAALGETLTVDDDLMNWCVGLSGAAMRAFLPVLEGMTQAGIEAGIDAGDARRMAAQVMLGTAALALQTGLSFEELKALTPMEMVDEAALSSLFQKAVRAAKEKMDVAQSKLWQVLFEQTS
jgi:pyrroline-5-carboxylate reductase